MGNFLKMKHIFHSHKVSSTQNTEVPKRRSRILKEIKRTGKTVREIFRKEVKRRNPQSLVDDDAAHHDAQQSIDESVQQPLPNDPNVAALNGAERPAEESLHFPQSDDNNDDARNDAEQPAEEHVERPQSQENNDTMHHNAEPFVEASIQQTPRTGGNDSGYNSPQDETSAWEKILEMRAREYENDLAAMQDLHDDELKYLRRDLSSEIRKKEHVQRWVKKEVLAKKDLKQQFDSLQGEYHAAVEASASKDKVIEEKEKEALALRARLQEIGKGFQNKEKSYLETVKAQGEEIEKKEEEVVDLRLRIYAMNRELLSKEKCHQGVLSEVGTNTLNAQTRKGAASAQWKAWYHHAFEEAQATRKELAICTSHKKQAMEVARDLRAQLGLAKTANGKLSAEAVSMQQQIDVDGRYHEQIRGQNFGLRKQVNEFIGDIARLKYQKAKVEQEAAAEVKHLTRKLDNRTAELSALEATRAEWQADPEGVLLTLSKGVTSDPLILALAKRFELTLNENDSLKQRMVVQEHEYDTLRAELVHSKAQNDGLSQSLAEKADEVACLKDRIHELETKVLSREMDDEVDKRAEPGYLQAMEELAALRAQLKHKALEYAASMANLAADGPRKAIQDLQRICGQASADYEALQQTLYEERRESYLDKAVVGSHILALNAQIANAAAHQQRINAAEKVWDRLRELEQNIELDRIARLNSDAVTLEIRAQLEERVAEEESQITHLLEEVQRLREAASENDEDVADSRAYAAQLDQARRAALQNRQQQVAEVEAFKGLVERLYERMLRLETTLAAAGRTIEEPHDEGEVLKAECARVLGYDDAESELEAGGSVNTTSGPETTNPIGAESQSGDHEDEAASQSDGGTNHNEVNEEPQNHSENESDDESEVEADQSSDSSTTITARRFVLRSLAEGETRTRVLGESSSPAVPPTPESSTPTEESLHDVPLDADDESDDDVSGDLQPYHPPPLPVTSLAWVKRNRPFTHGEPVVDDQFGKKA